MKLYIASILVMASAFISQTSAQADSRAPEYLARLTYLDGSCNGVPVFVTIKTLNAAGCTQFEMPCTNGVKKVCASNDPAEHVNFIKQTFQKRPFVLKEWYGKNSQCTGIPLEMKARLADGSCNRRTITTINEDLSLSIKDYDLNDETCSGTPFREETRPATESNGQCVISRSKTTAIRSESS